MTTDISELPRYEDTSYTPQERARIRLLTHELSITHPNLPAQFISLLAQVGAVTPEEELEAMLTNLSDQKQ